MVKIVQVKNTETKRTGEKKQKSWKWNGKA